MARKKLLSSDNVYVRRKRYTCLVPLQRRAIRIAARENGRTSSGSTLLVRPATIGDRVARPYARPPGLSPLFPTEQWRGIGGAARRSATTLGIHRARRRPATGVRAPRAPLDTRWTSDGRGPVAAGGA